MKRLLLISIGVILIAWLALTLLAERTGPAQSSSFGSADASSQALFTYNPDLFYNLDEQLCASMAEQLATMGWKAEVKTIAAAPTDVGAYDLVVFVANTYNWAPDWPTSRLIGTMDLSGKSTAAIMLGSGSTARAQRLLEEKLEDSGAEVLAVRSLWLMRPNDEERIEEGNVSIALDIAEEWIKGLADPQSEPVEAVSAATDTGEW